MVNGQGKGHRLSPQEMADEILRERDVIRKYVEQVAELRKRLTEYESKFGLSSHQIHAAIERGDLTETDEVSDWIFTYELLERSNALATGR